MTVAVVSVSLLLTACPLDARGLTIGHLGPVEVLGGLPQTRHCGQKGSMQDNGSYPETPPSAMSRHLCANGVAVDLLDSDAYWASFVCATASSEASDATRSASIMPRSMSREGWIHGTAHQIEHDCLQELDLSLL